MASIVDAIGELIAKVDENSGQAFSLTKEVAEIRQQLEAKADELQTLLEGERDARAKEKGEAQQAVEELKQQLEQVSASLTDKETEAKAASEETELTLLQLQKVQEELEHYFLLYRKQAEMLTSAEKLAERTAALLFKTFQ